MSTILSAITVMKYKYDAKKVATAIECGLLMLIKFLTEVENSENFKLSCIERLNMIFFKMNDDLKHFWNFISLSIYAHAIISYYF